LTAFILIGAVMVSIALGLVAWPIYKARSNEGRSALVVLGVLALALPVGAAVLYHSISNWDWDPAAIEAASHSGQHSLPEMVSQLEDRLKKTPDDVGGWLMLGRSRLVMNDFAAASSAFKRAYEVSNGKNVEAVLGYGATLYRIDSTAINGRAGELFEEALKLDPTNPEALWFGGTAARNSGRLDVARERWAATLKSGAEMPAEFRAMLVQQITDLDRQLGRKPDPELVKIAAAAAAAATAATPTSVPVAQASGGDGNARAAPPAATGTAGTVTVRVKLGPAVAGKVPPGALLFVLARDPTQPGPPFAVKRLPAAHLPLDVVLTEQDAMLPARTIKTAKQLLIVARFSVSGMPTASSGDVYGEIPYDLASAKPVDLLIDKLVP
jgi:cytochrome c-type biogenesis protein CcmH